MIVDFINGKEFVIDEDIYKSFMKIRRGMYCGICGKNLKVGHTARFIFANENPEYRGRNFYVCKKCDTGDNPEIIGKAIEHRKEFFSKKYRLFRIL